MRVRITTDIDTDTGDYQMTFTNLSEPGAPVEYTEVQRVLGKAFARVDDDIRSEVGIPPELRD